MSNASPRRILIVEDSSLIRRIYTLLLEEYSERGFDLTYVTNGQDALDFVRVNRVSLVLLDLSMPQMTGIEFLRICVSEGILATMPVIVVTAQHDDVELATALELGAAAFLLKPFDIKELRSIINAVLEPAEVVTEQERL